jgi:hypothetical protein
MSKIPTTPGGRAIPGKLSYKPPVGPKLSHKAHSNGQAFETKGNTSGGAKSMSPCNHGNCGTQHKG